MWTRGAHADPRSCPCTRHSTPSLRNVLVDARSGEARIHHHGSEHSFAFLCQSPRKTRLPGERTGCAQRTLAEILGSP